MQPKVYVITATVGTAQLEQCINSVQSQDYCWLEHIIVCDGEEYQWKVNDILNKRSYQNIKKITLPWNTGRDKFICHKIYASIPHLLHTPGYVMFLDEDNWLESTHISSLVKTLQDKKTDWVFALRNICSKDGFFICRDECESLGNISSTWLSEGDYLIDTSCYLVPIEIARQFSECWQRRAREHPEADRLFYHHLSSNFPNFCSSYLYTVNYRLEGRPDSVTAEFFKMGNAVMYSKK